MSTAPRTPSPDGCPVDHSKMSRARGGQSPLLAAPPAAPAALVCDSTALDTPPRPATHPILPPSSAGQCPVDHTKFARPAASSSSSSSAGPALAGPAIVGDHFPDATPQPNQRGKLSTAAVASTIPKGGADQPADATWVFPSPQRFFNAMAKKGWNPKEPDMQWVVSIHNTVNEATWRKVLEFEQMHADECAQPKLVRFKGRPSDLSPKARILGWMGYVAPFDRHDWVVDRCGKEITYVIDFYNGAGSDMAIQMPGMPPAIHLDVRPALTPMGAIDRMRWQFNQWFPAKK